MAKTVTASFEDLHLAQRAVDKLVAGGTRRSQVTLREVQSTQAVKAKRPASRGFKASFLALGGAYGTYVGGGAGLAVALYLAASSLFTHTNPEATTLEGMMLPLVAGVILGGGTGTSAGAMMSMVPEARANYAGVEHRMGAIVTIDGLVDDVAETTVGFLEEEGAVHVEAQESAAARPGRKN